MDQQENPNHMEHVPNEPENFYEWYRVSCKYNNLTFITVEFDAMDININTMPLIRCLSCQSYLNCYCEVINPGMQWKCSLCNMINQVEQPFIYKNNSYRQTEQIEIYNRQTFENIPLISELYELEAPENFNVKTTDPPIICFLIDISLEGRKNKLLDSVIHAIKECLKEAILENAYDCRTRVALFFFSEHVYILNKTGTISVITGAMPLLLNHEVSFGLFTEDFEILDELIEKVIEYFNKMEANNNNNILAAIKLISMCFRSGSIYSFISSMPNSGISSLKPNNRFVINNEYKQILESLQTKSIALNLFMCTKTTLEYGQMRILTQGGGQVFHYTNYDGDDPIYTEKLFTDLNNAINGEIYYNALMRVRVSEGVTIRKVRGNCISRGNDLFAFPNYVSAHSISLELSSENQYIVQLAMIRTRKNGLKTIRVCTLNSKNINETGIQELALGLFHNAIEKEIDKEGAGSTYLDTTLKSMFKSEDSIIIHNRNILASYFSAFKKNLLMDNTIAIDFRAFYVYLFMNSTIEILDRISYPVLININNTVECLNLSLNSIIDDQIYIMDCGINLFVFIGQTNETYHEIFDIDNNISLSGITLFENIKDNKFGKFVNELIIYFTTNKKVKPRYILVHDREHSVYSEIFRRHLYDDQFKKVPDVLTYYNEMLQ